jgi:hypothetical protein
VSVRGTFLLILLVAIAPASAQSADAPLADPLAGITFPIAELEGCGSREACAAYCDIVGHFQVCTEFANARGLTAAQVGAPIQFPVSELGECGSPAECRLYCEQPTALAACLDFAVKNNVIEKAEADDARLVIPHLIAGDAPGACTSETTCQTYCEESAHIDECLDFGLRTGAITQEEATAARTIKNGGGPGACTTRISCKAYCDDPANRYTCFTYAKENKLISDEEAAVGQRFFDMGAVGPAGCVSKDECVDTCNDPTNFDACVEFAHGLGIINDDDWKAAKIIRDAGGPGGCQTKAECESYCDSAEHYAACGQAFGQNSRMALGGALPGPCLENGLDPAACQEYCRANGPACATGGALPPGSLPAVCESAGATTSEGCLHLCSTPPYPCGGAAPSGVGPVLPDDCTSAGITSPEDCMTYCNGPTLPCGGAAPPGMGPSAGSEGLPLACVTAGLAGNDCSAYCASQPTACAGAQAPTGPPAGVPEACITAPSSPECIAAMGGGMTSPTGIPAGLPAMPTNIPMGPPAGIPLGPPTNIPMGPLPGLSG